MGDIDFLKRQLAVSRQLQREGDTYIARAPKYGSERIVYLPDELLDVLARHLQEHLGRDLAGPVAVHDRRPADVRQRGHLAVAGHP